MSRPTDRELVFPDTGGEMAKLMRVVDWAATPVGPVEQWPTALRAAVRMMLTSRFAMWMGWGDDLTFFYNDTYFADTLGSKHPWALGRPAREVWREIWPEIGPRVAAVLSDGRATWDEGLRLLLERNGYPEETYHTFSYSPLYEDDGRIRGLLCVVTEDTGRVISERRVGLLGRFASEMAGAKTAEDVLAALDRCLASDARDLPFTLTFLFDRDEPRLASRTGFAAATTPPQIAWPLDEIVAEGQPVEIDLPAAAWPTGPWAVPPSRALVVPIPQQGQGRPAGAFIAAISPHRAFDAAYREFITLLVGQLAAGLASAQAYEAERRRAESLAELDRAKTAFFSNVSHEFRTPLTLMLGPLGGLVTDPDIPRAYRDELTTVQRNGRRLLKLVNTMLDFSRIEAGRATAQFVPTDLAQLTSDLASVFRAATEKAGLRLVVDCPDLGSPVRVDRDMWEKIVLNLISNAFKFTLDGEISIALARRGGEVELTVRDTGVGIPADQLGHVFERFHRVEGSKGRTHEGTGIGLALVQELVRLHGGAITVASELGRGTEFRVAIPVRPDPEDAATSDGVVASPPGFADALLRPNAFVEEALRWLPDASGSFAVPDPAASRDRLLVVDDNADMRDYMRRLLGDRWQVDAVANGRQALAAIRVRPPDLIITDVMMPELDGFGLLAEIRADRALAELPVIMLSARAGEEARIEGLRAGASDYLGKPFASRELIARVETHLMRAAERAHTAHLRAIFEQAPVAIAVLRGPDHVFEVANPPYRRIIGERDVIGRRVADAVPAAVVRALVPVLDEVYRTGEPFIGHSIPLQRSQGGAVEDAYYDVIYQPLTDESRAVTGIAAVVHEVTELARAQRDAESANRAKDEFLAMLGHELRNPLAPITTALELMRLRPGVGAERERAVIERQVQHLVGLVEDLLDVSRITRGKVELRRQSVDIAEIVARSVEVVSPLLEEHRHALAIDVPSGLSVFGDPTRLAQVVSNLLTNAAKYTPRGGQIDVRAWREADAAVISVRDNGIGIEPSMLRQIFEPFAQERQSIERARGGLGLGLAIVDNLVKLHGGTVVARSEGRNRGSELIVSLPLLLAETTASRRAAPRKRSASQAEARILVIDDNVDAAQLLADLLAAGGYHTLAAHDGPSALEAAGSFQPQIAVVDLGLPVMDGFELARLMLARPQLIRPKLVALTGYGQAEDRARTAAAGFDAHLVKPVDIDQLRSVIERLLPRPVA